MMLKVGLTGGIGSGKSTVAKIFETLGVPVYYADIWARNIINEDKAVISAVTSHFGPKSYKDGKLDRIYISGIVFNDPAKLELLNSLTHPATISHASKWMEKQTTPYIIKEAALLFESGSSKSLDLIIGVYAPKELRIQRVIQRDSISREAVIKIMDRQMDEEEKMKRCDHVIINDEQKLVVPQVIALHKKLLAEI